MLAHSFVSPKAANPDRVMLFVHGILGTRANWRGIARQFVEARPGWGAVLVDLREHGDSLGLPEPHTVRAAAADLDELAASLTLPVGGALGHSFGGKVVLEWLRSRHAESTEAWIIDASPSSRAADRDTTATTRVIEVLASLPRTWASQDDFIDAVVEAGQPRSVARWLAMNLRRTDGGRRSFGPRLEVIRSLIDDYARTDCWDVLEALPEPCTLGVVIGGLSNVFSASDRDRVQRIASQNPRISVFVVEDAGHWVHMDAPEQMVALLTSHPSPQR